MGRIPTIYYCPYENCSASYCRKDRYETHIRSHTGEKPFICSYEDCGKSFTSSSHLKRHEGTHGSSYRCTVENCLEILKTKDTLRKHIKEVHLKLKKHKVYTCTQCGKEFNKHNTLQKHELRHSGQLPHKCSFEDCQKAFLTPSKLKRHMKVHEGYPCKISDCDKVFGKWTLYVQHVRDCHRPEIKCKVCDKVFSTSFGLKLHAPLHDESRLVYPCQVPNCSRYYFAERNLKWHMRKYHAKRPFMCDKENCHRAFKTEADLAEHVLYHDKKKPRKKNKPKKPKPSLAAILSGYAEVEQMNEKSKEILTEEKAESNISACFSKVNLISLESDRTKISSVDSLESNQSSINEENNSCIFTNKDDANCIKSPVPNSFESSQLSILKNMNTSLPSGSNNSCATELEVARLISKENFLEMNQSTTAEVLDFISSKNIIPVACEVENSLNEVEVTESIIQEYTTIEVVNGENLSQLVSVPVIKIGDEHWNRNAMVHIKTGS
ncbi:transcription factor IIIA-like isoform X2 [Argiope bruennichi]|uniref:transcription factor IIIA-like isoform X2 n=1 Tax=Argiope bruennichi TaxID=94029 RepID=UPI00249408CD|nr:transcription factor IIIA-like isoform X2 [Argiope bruennichi]